MSDAGKKQVLVVSGDYGVIRQTRHALRGELFAVQNAYSYADALYSLENTPVDVVVVDAGMVDRRSGTVSFVGFSQQNSAIPIIALVAGSRLPEQVHFPANTILATLDDRSILQSVSGAVNLLSPSNGGRAPEIVAPTAAEDTSPKRPEEMQTLIALSKSLTEVLELTEVLNRVVEAARHLTNAEEGMILLPDDEAGQLYLRAKVGIDIEVARNFRVKTDDTLAGNVFNSGKPVLIGAQGPQKVKTEYLVNALLYVPILYNGVSIGVLGVNNKSNDRTFEPRHQDLLMNLASFAAVAIENARVHEESLTRARELQILVEASQSVNSNLSLDTILPTICAQLVRVLNVGRSEILEWDKEHSQLQTLARCLRAIWLPGQGPVVDLESWSALHAALSSNRCLVVTRERTPPDSLEMDYIQRVGVETMLAIPIFAGEQVLGAVQVFYVKQPANLPHEEILQRIQHLALEVLVNLSNQQVQNRQQTAFRVPEEINKLAGADWCELSIMTTNKKALGVSIAVGQGVWLDSFRPCFDLTLYPDLIESIQSQTLINKQSETQLMSKGVRALLDATSSRALLGLPLVQRGQTQGLVLFADSRRNRVFGQSDIDMGRAIVAQAATALENAHLVHDLENSLRDLQDAQGRLIQTARLSAMGELAAAVAHQINNPLTTIMVDSEMMLMDEPPGSRNHEPLEAISRAGKRAAGVARRLLAIARPNDPDAPPQPIDVLDTIEGVLSLVQAHIQRDQIEIVVQLPQEKLPSVWAIHGQLDDIWLNLLLNAHDALIGRAGARIGIAAVHKPPSEYIEVVIWDNGPGIPDEIRNEIFKPFFTTKPVGEGTGLGLHICQQVIERVGGSISVESSPEKGTRFLVRLPTTKQRGVE